MQFQISDQCPVMYQLVLRRFFLFVYNGEDRHPKWRRWPISLVSDYFVLLINLFKNNKLHLYC